METRCNTENEGLRRIRKARSGKVSHLVDGERSELANGLALEDTAPAT
ncbi:hypothetical protein LSI01_02260 [Furfurilactobacillus siliginis]|uniref:Uncharacterized protein n=1 Tax=Furfurilactobacillus siliginis TaxID=348151 RepID=A0A510VSF7_9LACO|nr:hypothetical protein LSI01_02260 [Furfurilactobacillus siliginis]